MDGTDGIINLLEIFQAGDTDHTSYTRRLSKIKTTYQFLKPTAKSEEINTLIEMLEILYEKWGLKPTIKNKHGSQFFRQATIQSFPIAES